MQTLGHLNADSPQQEEEGEVEHQNTPARFFSPQECSFYERQQLNMLIKISFYNTMKIIICRILTFKYSTNPVNLFYEKMS